ncbi:MAG: GH25 family lysozyme [Bacillota bacterium]|nr:GH25 family lysozyme [Bacillota bacterium]
MQPINLDNLRGIDVSNHNGNINWKLVKDAGYSFVFIKSTEGCTFVDSFFKSNYENAKANGIITGPYHFARPYNDPSREAVFFVNSVKSMNGFQKGDLPPVLDIEVNEGLNNQQISDWIQSFISVVKQETGLQTIIYTYLNFSINYIENIFSNIPLWFARYDVNVPEDTAGWNRWTFLQYTDKGTVSGIDSDAVDLNVFYGLESDLTKFINGTGSANDVVIGNNNLYPILQFGDTGEGVRILQKLLAKSGVCAGKIDGIFGNATKNAVENFQSKKALVVDGIDGPITMNALNKEVENNFQNLHTLLAFGSTGEDVKVLQALLDNAGYSAGIIDGIFGTNTQKAVKAFQSANGLDSDGIAGVKTWSVIKKY